MKRLIEFNYQDENYILKENDTVVFSIKVSDLKFNSPAFYEGIYKGKHPNIELLNKIESDPHKKGTYIFSWLSEIISAIRNEFPELVSEDEMNQEANTTPFRLIPLFEFSACAGDGFFIDETIPHKGIPAEICEADFAVRISGNSMEPTIEDGSIIYVKKVEELQHDDIGLFVVNGDVMCKRIKKQGRGVMLVPDNNEYESIRKKNVDSFKILGKVLI